MSADVDPARASHARVVAGLTRQTLVMLQNVERGLLPVRVLEKVCDPRIIAAISPIPPPKPTQLRAPRRVGRIRVHLVNDRLAHVAAVATRPDGRPSGYVLELHRRHDDRHWTITELTRVEQRRILGAERQIAEDRDERAAWRQGDQPHRDLPPPGRGPETSDPALRSRVALRPGGAAEERTV